MGSRRHRSVTLLVALLSCWSLALVACGPVPAAAPEAALRVQPVGLDDIARALNVLRGATKAPALVRAGGKSIDDAFLSVDDVLRRAPAGDSAFAARLAELRAARAQALALRTAVAAADLRGADIPAAADAAAAGATAEPAVRRELKAAGEAILRDVACDVAFDGLVPVDKEEVEARGYVDVVPDVPGLYDEPFPDAVIKFAQARIARALGPGVGTAVDWYHYVDGIESNARTYQVGLEEQVVTPNGARSQAFVQYVRICLARPR